MGIRRKFNDLRAKTLYKHALQEPMAFEYRGLVFKLEFTRYTPEGSTKPSTTVRLEEFIVWRNAQGRVTSHGWVGNRSATVGCYHRDDFSKEDGRRAAITLLCRGYYAKHPLYEKREEWREFRRAIWNAYFERFRP